MVHALVGIVLLLTMTGCPNKKQPAAPGPRQFLAGSSNEGILKLTFSVNEAEGIGQLFIQNIPESADLSCAINKKLIEPCADQAELNLPNEDGEHALTVVARVSGQVKAVGETHFEIGKPSRKRQHQLVIPGANSRIYNDDLTIEIDEHTLIQGQPFQDGMSIRRTEDVIIPFRFAHTPLCEPVIRCTTDRANAKFEPLCDLEHGKSYRARTMPKGLQFLRIQATCGDKAGEPLTVFWYGVEENYKYMALDTTFLGTRNSYVFNLMNPSDCPENLLKYECRNSASETFHACEGVNGAKNTITNPPEGFAMRAVCNGTAYEAYEAIQN